MRRPVGTDVNTMLRRLLQVEEHTTPEDAEERWAAEALENVGYGGVSPFIAVPQDSEDRAEDRSERIWLVMLRKMRTRAHRT